MGHSVNPSFRPTFYHSVRHNFRSTQYLEKKLIEFYQMICIDINKIQIKIVTHYFCIFVTEL